MPEMRMNAPTWWVLCEEMFVSLEATREMYNLLREVLWTSEYAC